jgi:hypothetical protein
VKKMMSPLLIFWLPLVPVWPVERGQEASMRVGEDEERTEPDVNTFKDIFTLTTHLIILAMIGIKM